MVMFYEDDKKIRPPATKLRRRVRLGFRVVVVVAVMFGFSLLIMNALGGSSDVLRSGVQDYLRSASGMEAEIGKFEGVTFFPEVSVAISDISFRREVEKDPVATVGSMNFSMGFWDVFFRRERIRVLEVKNVHFDAGVLTVRPLDIERIGMDVNNENKKMSRLAVTGMYGEAPFSIGMVMDARDIGGGRMDFHRAAEAAVTVDFPFLKIDGVSRRARGGGLQFDFSSIGTPEKILEGQVVLWRSGEKLALTASLRGGDSAVDIDLQMQGRALDGKIIAPVFDLEDIGRFAALNDAFAEFSPAGETVDFSGQAIDLDIAAEKLKKGDDVLGNINALLHLAGNVLTVGQLGGVFGGGALSGALELDAKEMPAKFKVSGALKNWRYVQVSEAVDEGKADINVSVTGAGATWAELWNSLQGDAVLIAGEGKLAGGMLNLWGGGLMAAMLPDFKPEDALTLNCAIADFKINGGVGRPAALFIDMPRLSVTGDGEINIPQNKVDIRLTPGMKDVSPGALSAVPVRISGPFSNLSVAPDAAGAGANPGAVNPALLALSTVDLGLTKEHPCYQFIGALPETKPEPSAP